MKKFNRIIAVSFLLYILLAVIAGYVTAGTAVDKEKLYKVEINRLYNSLSKDLSLDKLDLDTCSYVRNVSILNLSESSRVETVTRFFEEDNRYRTDIRPLIADGTIKGYLKFDYEEPGYNTGLIFWVIQASLFILELFSIIVLVFIKQQVIKPYDKMSQLPYELAKGHFNGYTKEVKNKYFGKFLWGIGQLKDTLEVTKKRELELEKEKKLLLLSLSHDIKTPLNTIKLYGKALEEDLYKEEAQKKHAVCQIGEKALQIEHYVEEIMANSREDILDIDVHNSEFYLSDLMESILETYREKCTIRMIDLKVDVYQNRLLHGDLERSLEVFENIFENAFKYGNGIKIELTFWEEDFCQLIRIFNTGNTVTDNEFNHIFESFYRGENSRGKQGNGLGLYICREIMRKMDGDIFAEKTPEGMAFVLVFR